MQGETGDCPDKTKTTDYPTIFDSLKMGEEQRNVNSKRLASRNIIYLSLVYAGFGDPWFNLVGLTIKDIGEKGTNLLSFFFLLLLLRLSHWRKTTISNV